jgi:uncharacterized membrane protein
MKRQVTPSPEAGDKVLELARSLTLFVYVMHALASATLVTFFVAIFVNTSRRDRVVDTIYESHFDWQVKTFWYSLLYFSLACVFIVWGFARWADDSGSGMFVLGLLLALFNLCWHLYRVITGLMRWSDRKPMHAN